MDEGRLYDELRTLHRALQVNPRDVASLFRRGQTYQMLNRPARALTDFNRALDLDPDNAAALKSRALAYYCLGLHDAAVTDLNRALDLESDDPFALRVRGETHARLKRYDEALRDFDRALELKPGDLATTQALRSLLVEMGDSGEPGARRQDTGHGAVGPSWSIPDPKSVFVSPAPTRATRSAQPRTDVVGPAHSAVPAPSSGSNPASNLARKLTAREFDVFLCHNSKDKPEVKVIGQQLKDLAILPWLDEWDLRPGFPWQEELNRQIGSIKSTAVFVGKSGLGPWQEMEQEAFLYEFTRRRLPVIPVILESLEEEAPALPAFLAGMTWVDFRIKDPDPMERLVWGIRGERGR